MGGAPLMPKDLIWMFEDYNRYSFVWLFLILKWTFITRDLSMQHYLAVCSQNRHILIDWYS